MATRIFTVGCKSCGDQREIVLRDLVSFLTVVEFAWENDIGENRFIAEGIERDYPLRRYECRDKLCICPNCHQYESKIWLKIDYKLYNDTLGIAEKFESYYECPQCNLPLIYLNDIHKITRFTCPKCNNKALVMGDTEEIHVDG